METNGVDNYGLNPHYKYTELELDSLDAVISNDSQYTSTDWPVFTIASPLSSLSALKVLEVQIPFSFYVVNSSNNTFLMTDNLVTDKVISIPEGNYTSTTLGVALVARLLVGSANGWTCTYSSLLGVFTFGNTSGAANTFTFKFGVSGDSGATNPRFVMGFGSAGSYTSTTSQVLIAPNVASVGGPNYLYINSRAIGSSLPVLLPGGATQLGSGSSGPQIAKIPINVQPGGVIYWSDSDPQKWFSLDNLPILSQFDLYITIGNNAVPTVTQLNGLSFSVKLGLLQQSTLSAAQYGGSSNSPGATVVADFRKRMRQ